MLGALDGSSIAAFVAAAGPGTGSSLVTAELRQLGAAVGRRIPSGGAVSALDGEFLLFGCAFAPDSELAAEGRADARRLTSALAPWTQGRRFASFIHAEVDPAELHEPGTYERLRQIRAANDPGRSFHGAHVVTAA